MNPTSASPATLPPGARYGAEYEWADWPRSTPIPPELGELDEDEVTICNSDGTPFGKRSAGRGGEINLRPSDSIDEALDRTRALVELLPGARISHRCFLHIHISLPGLTEDVAAAQRILRYSLDPRNADALDTLSSWDTPLDGLSDEDRKFTARWNRTISAGARDRVPADRHEELFAATTPREFYDAHFRPTRDGRTRAYGVMPRPALNLRSLHKHGTVEFRTFGGTTDLGEIRYCFEFAARYLAEALSDSPVPVAEYADPSRVPRRPLLNIPAERRFLAEKELEKLL